MDNYPPQSPVSTPVLIPPSAPRKSSKRLLYILTTMVLVLLAGAGMWYYQQKKINELESKVASLETQLYHEKEKAKLYEMVGELDEQEVESPDTERETDIKALHGQVEAYYAQNGRYPTLANINDANWRHTNMKGLDDQALKEPSGGEMKLVAAKSEEAYAYVVTPANCDNAVNGDCSGYELIAVLDSGKTYSKSALN